MTAATITTTAITTAIATTTITPKNTTTTTTTLDTMSKRTKPSTDRFLASMTFAHNNGDACDCDECGINEIPADIAEAINERKKQKLLSYLSSHISQERSLIQRYDGCSIWKLAMPPGAQALTEYGNSHRLVFVDYMPLERRRVVKSIGKGIIGSSSEEQSRKQEDWKEFGGYWYPSNGGRAIGWVNEKQQPADKDLNVSDTSNDVVVYIVKATQDIVETFAAATAAAATTSSTTTSDESSVMPTWVSDIMTILQKYLANDDDKKKLEASSWSSASSETPASNVGKEIEADDAKSIQNIIYQLLPDKES